MARGARAAPPRATALAAALALRATDAAKPTPKPEERPPPACPGELRVDGLDGPVSLVPTGWKSPWGAEEVEVLHGAEVVPHMSSRSYFASTCRAGKYNNTEYIRMPLLGKTLRYTTDLGGAGCGCNAAFYLTSMGHNTHESDCLDYYCDANNVCGRTCTEIDIQEANLYSFHATLHGKTDHFGTAAGEGGGGPGWNGPRDWDKGDYSPGGKCIDSSLPFEVAVSFPTEKATGSLKAMWVSLTQVNKSGYPCRISLELSHYKHMKELSKELEKGMTPIVSYWGAKDMSWLDGRGHDHKGLCARDSQAKCAESVKFYDFSLSDISDEDRPVPPKKPKTTTTQPDKGHDSLSSEATTFSTTASKESWEQWTSSSQPWEQPSSSSEQTAGSLDWWNTVEGRDWQSSDDQQSSDDEQSSDDWQSADDWQWSETTTPDHGTVTEDGNCVEFDNTRKEVVGGKAVQINFRKTAYGAHTSWKECRKLCAQDKKCKQVVFYKPEGSCFGTAEARGDDQDNMAGLNYDFISAQCNNPCADFDNWRKSEAGRELALGKYEFGAEAEDWSECRARCASEEACKQVVYYRPERKCYGMGGRANDDQDNMGGNNPNFISAHCHLGDSASGAGGAGGTVINTVVRARRGRQEEKPSRVRGSHLVMQKKYIGFPRPALQAGGRRWLLACCSLLVGAAFVACAAVAVVAARRRNLRTEPLETLRRIASGGDVAGEDDGLMRSRPSSEHLLEMGGKAALPPPAGSAMELQQHFF